MDTEPIASHSGLGRSLLENLRAYPLEAGISLVSGISLVFLGWLLAQEDFPLWALVVLATAGALALFWLLTRKSRRRKRLRSLPFPPEWEAVLQRQVVFFQALPADEQVRFRQQIQIFLHEKRITGVGTKLDPTVRVLTAASAIIPIFGFPEWEWHQISEVLIYPHRFNEDFQFKDAEGRQILGMVGTGGMNGIMILAKPDLMQGFKNPGDKRNVGLHEFAHLVDKSDGSIDGVPEVGLGSAFIGPWIELVRRKMQEMEAGDSDLNPYGLTNEAEFFAVATEYFFEKPGLMRRKHPELYSMLARVFHQDLASRAKAMVKAALNRNRSFGRNSRCPCGSGLKYKKCCLRRSAATR
ncbi:MAG: zinc-dependent peptidase [Deltaproteobacteria bacterium]|nr:zinc-dependent peptidase [Deltaproteobacteria bacterium]